MGPELPMFVTMGPCSGHESDPESGHEVDTTWSSASTSASGMVYIRLDDSMFPYVEDLLHCVFFLR